MTAPHRSAADFLPARRTLASLRRAAAECQGCELYRRATQTVFGAGPRHARIMFVGEQPGDKEDIAGRPFVGPAGRLLDRALQKASLPRDAVYVTNAVKHFKWSARGKRRLHQRPREGEIDACRPWLLAELQALNPDVVVCLGATAAQSMLNRAVRLKDVRGQLLPTAPIPVFVTIHPASILRAMSDVERQHAFDGFVEDLLTVRRFLRTASAENPKQVRGLRRSSREKRL